MTGVQTCALPIYAAIVMANLPLALIGGVAGVFLAGGVLSVASMIGFITLFGIATRNGIMLVSHIEYLMNEEGVTDFREAVARGARERLVPILMTAMAAGLALIPLALGGGKTGSEIQTPMAIVILCGLTTSTLLNMIVVPTLYLRYGDPSLEGKRRSLSTARCVRNQNAIRRPNCISRGFFALKMRPKFGVPNVRFGMSKFARLNRLKISQRNSSCEEPAMAHVFAMARSTLANPGPITLFRGALPNVNGAGSAKAAVLNHRSGVRSPPGKLGSCSWSGRCAGPAPILAWSTPRLTVNGAPDCAVRIVLTRQPPKACSVNPPAPTNSGSS